MDDVLPFAPRYRPTYAPTWGRDTSEDTVNSVLLDALERLTDRVKSGKLTEASATAFVRRLVNSPAVALLVKMTPNPVDDVALEFLKGLFPPA